jgi:predicted glycosyltransferase
VGMRRDQSAHDERASVRANEYFDAVLVHADPAFARLEDSFRPATPLEVPVHYTGFVAPLRPESLVERERRVIVSAGGGSVGEPLVRAALAAHPRLWRDACLSTTIVTGPFAPDDLVAEAMLLADGTPGLEVARRVDDLCGEMRRSMVTVSQCGYNTAMDILRADTPAVVVPYAEGREDEQTRRAEQLEQLGVLRSLSSTQLSGGSLAHAVLAQLNAPVPEVRLDLEGRAQTASIILDLLIARRLRSPVGVR